MHTKKYPYTHTTRLKNVAKKKRKSLLICASLLLGIPRNSDGAPPGPLDIQALPFPPSLLLYFKPPTGSFSFFHFLRFIQLSFYSLPFLYSVQPHMMAAIRACFLPFSSVLVFSSSRRTHTFLI